MPRQAKNTEQAQEFSVTQRELALLMGRDDRMIRKWESASVLQKDETGKYPVLANMKAALDYLCSASQQKAATNADKLTEQIRNLKLDAEAKERSRKKDEGEWLEVSVWLDKLSEHIGDLRAKVKILLLTDQPAHLSGRPEADIREANGKTYVQFCQWMQNAATKLRPAASKSITVSPE